MGRKYFEAAKKLLDWAPQTNFREGLEKLVTWYEKNRIAL